MTSSSMASQSGASSSSSSSASPSIRPWNHDVFLSFRGEDTRNNFTAHLYQALNQRGIKTYKDSVDLERGEKIQSELFKAIEESQISIIVFSKNYAESRWCLHELLKILECKKRMKRIVLPIFYKVKPSEVREQKGRFGEAFTKLGEKIRDDIKPLLESWKKALEEVANLSGLEYLAGDESEFIQKIIQWVDSRIANQTSVARYPVGIESRIRDIYDQHLNIGMKDIIRVVGIFGTGGIGKTTISNDIYSRISSQFEGSCFLRNIRETSKRAGGLLELQKTLLFKILGKISNIDDVDRAINVIRDRLSSKRILLVLDDVDEMVQLEKLAGDRDWFGSGSRILITTRDQHLLKVFEVDSKYEVMILNDEEALQLFRLHAFKKDEPLEEYMELSKQVTKYAQGLPLALKVLGSDLKGRSISQWKSALDKLKRIPNKDIQMILRTSYDGLDDNEKDIFLDIACFFKTERVDYVVEILDSCRFFPADGIPRLMDKCLISVDEYGKLWMHDLIQEMGREIVRQESPKEPGKRSRLWFHEDVCSVLEENTVTNKIEGILIDLPERDLICLGSKAFRKMTKLRIFINRNARLSGGPNYLSNELRLLDLGECPLQSLPSNFHGKELIDFRMRHGLIKELGDRFIPKNLTTMTFVDCEFLEKIPDLSSISNLKELIAKYCTRLVEVHDSVGSLENLSRLGFEGCSKLHILPRSLNLRSLSYLNFTYCSSLRYLPEIECKMECLTDLYLDGTAIEELPLSIGNLVELGHLSLSHCKNLMRLPTAFIQLQYLFHLNLDGCPNIVKKMRDDGQSLLAIESTKMEEEISLREEPIHEFVPPTNSSNRSTALQLLNLQSCFQSETNFFPISSLFTMLNSFASLDWLDLSETGIVSLPTSIKELVALSSLYLCMCEKLEEIPELPPNIRGVDVSGCKSLERFPEVSKILEFNGSHIRSLRLINLTDCDKMHVNIWNDKVQNPLLWKGVYEYDATLFPENNIPDWLSYVHKFLKDNEMLKGPDDDVGPRKKEEWVIDIEGPDDDVRPRKKEEWVIDIEGPHYLEEMSGIVLCVIICFKDASLLQRDIGDPKITSNSSNHVCCIREGVQLAHMDWSKKQNRTQYAVWVGYSNLQSFGLKVLGNLRVQFDFHHPYDGMVRFYKICRAKVVYKKKNG